MQRNVIAAAEAAGALLVTLENVYGYGPTGGRPMTEDHPLAATTVKGRTRAAMTRELLRSYVPDPRDSHRDSTDADGEIGHSVEIRSVPKVVLGVLGVVNPMMRGVAEMRYQFDEDFVLDTSKFESTFGAATTPLSTAIADTVAWFRTRTARP